MRNLNLSSAFSNRRHRNRPGTWRRIGLPRLHGRATQNRRNLLRNDGGHELSAILLVCGLGYWLWKRHRKSQLSTIGKVSEPV